MKNFSCSFFLYLYMTSCLYSQPLEPTKYEWLKDTVIEVDEIKGPFNKNVAVCVKDGKFGLINSRGIVTTQQKYDFLKISDRNPGLVIAFLDGKQGIIRLSGSTVIEPIYDYCEVLDQLIIVEQNGKYGLLSKDGQTVQEIQYEGLKDLNSGMLQYKLNGKLGLINSVGIKLSYNEDIARCIKIGDFNEGLARIENREHKYGYIDKNGQLKIPFSYLKASDFSEGLAPIQKDDNYKKWGYINKKAEIVIPAIYDDIKPFKDGFAVVHKDGKWGVISYDAKIREYQQILPNDYQEIESLGEGLFKVQYNNKWAIYHQKNRLTDYIYKAIDAAYFNGIIKVTGQDGKTGALNKTGEIVIPIIFEDTRLSRNRMVRVKEKSWGCYDTLGKPIATVLFEKMDDFYDGLAYIKDDRGYGFMDLKGNIVIQPAFKQVTSFNDGIAAVQDWNGKWGIIHYIKERPTISNQIKIVEPLEDHLMGEPHLTDISFQKIKVSVIMDEPIGFDDCVLDFYCKDCRTSIAPKSREGNLFDEKKVNTFFQYTYEKVLEFHEEGSYIVRLDVYKNGKLKKRGTTIEINYRRRNSDLHLITLGPAFGDLEYTDNDAIDVETLFNNQKSKFYREVHLDQLINKDVTEAGILKKLNKLKDEFLINKIDEDDVIVLFYSGHGFLDDDNTFYLQPYDFDATLPKETGISLNQIYDRLNDIPCKKIILLDACRSGANIDGTAPAPHAREVVNMTDIIQRFSEVQNNWTLISSSGKEKSYEYEAWENGIFTEALLEGLGGKADNRKYGNEDGYVTIQELFNYLEKRVPELCPEEFPERKQYPQMRSSETNKVLKIVKYN